MQATVESARSGTWITSIAQSPRFEQVDEPSEFASTDQTGLLRNFCAQQFFIARFVYNIPVPVERVIIFPMAIIPNLFGVWNMAHLASRAHTRLPLGIHGAILPFIIAPAGFLLGRGLGFLHTTHYGFVYFGAVEIHYTFLAVVFPVALIVYYLVWKYLIGFCNRVARIAE